MAGIRSIGVTRLAAGSGITLSGNIGNITISSSGGGGSPGGSTTQIQINTSGAFAGYASFTFDGTHTLGLGDSSGAIIAIGGSYVAPSWSVSGATIQTIANTGGTWGNPILLLDQTLSSSRSPANGVLIGMTQAQPGVGNAGTFSGLSFNGRLDSSIMGLFVTLAPSNYPVMVLQGWDPVNFIGNVGLSCYSGAGLTFLHTRNSSSGNYNTIIGAAGSALSDNDNGALQITASFSASRGISWGNDSIQCSIYRYAQSVIALGPSNLLLGALSGTLATDGWPYIPSSAGAPTGTPNNVIAGYVPCQVDESNGKVWFYYGSAWHFAALT